MREPAIVSLWILKSFPAEGGADSGILTVAHSITQSVLLSPVSRYPSRALRRLSEWSKGSAAWR